MRPNDQHRGGGRGKRSFGASRGGRGSDGGRGFRGGRGASRGGRGRDGGRVRDGGHSNHNAQQSMNNLKETDVGITEFIGCTPPFNGIIKAKFSDFQVNEIDLEGNVVTLTSFDVPEAPVDEAVEKILNTADPELDGLVTAEQWEDISNMTASGDKDKCVLIDVTDMSKEDRQKVHVTIKDRFGKSVNSSTVSEADKKCIKVSLFAKGAKLDTRRKWTWPHEYTYFVVHKFNMDTMKACSELALQLRVNPSVLTYAGTKDKRANTSQLFCIRKQQPSTIARAAQRIAQLKVGNFSFKPVTLKLGHLQGNRFKIALRQISVDTGIVEESLRTVKERGFINYYGLQRFGNSAAVPTFAIGKALLQGKWSEAVELILKPREGDQEFMQKMRECWWKTRDAVEARSMLHPQNSSIEAKLLFGLVKHNKNDVVNALEFIPRNTRLLYMHSYQSLLWNKAASRRVKLGLEPLVGDLVFVDQSKRVVECIEDDLLLAAEGDEGAAKEEEGEEKGSEDGEKQTDFKGMVRQLTQSDIDAGSYTMFDIVLPLPGHDILYPGNEIGEYYNQLLAEDELSSETLKQKNKTYSVTGAYRKMVERAGDMTWKFVKYNSDQDMLMNNDFELMRRERLIALPEDGKLTACLLEFSLSSSTYATMALREILKIDTSTQNQIKLAQQATTTTTEGESVVGDVAVEAEEEPAGKKVKLAEDCE